MVDFHESMNSGIKTKINRLFCYKKIRDFEMLELFFCHLKVLCDPSGIEVEIQLT